MDGKRVSELPGVAELSEDALFVVEQGGTASKVTGAQLAAFIGTGAALPNGDEVEY